MSIFNSLGMAGRNKMLERNFQEYSDNIGDPDRAVGVKAMTREFIQNLEDGEFNQIGDGIKFKVLQTDEKGLQFVFVDKEGTSHSLYLDEPDSRFFFDEIVAVREGLWKDVTLQDKVNNVEILIAATDYDTYNVVINQGNALICNIVGQLGVVQKFEYAILYARYYNR